MNLQAVVRRYANALFDVAAKSHAVEAVQRDLVTLVEVYTAHPDLRQVLAAPTVTPKQKRDVLDAVIMRLGALSPETTRTLTFLADRDRLTLIPELARAFDARARIAARVVSAEIVTAIPLGPQEREALAKALGTATGASVEMTERVDPTIIGGVIANVGSLVFDGSVTRQIERMRERLLADA
jgi:F-type H+-transporting ATPase subunit delta